MLESIHINNFKCLKGSHIIYFDEGIYSIKGKKDGDFNKSNRAGKTSFLEAIRFALFKGPVSQYTTEGESEMSVTLNMNSTEFYVGTGATMVNGENVLVSQLRAISESCLGMDYTMLACTVAAFSDYLYGFLSLKPKEQKEFLLNYFCDTNVDWDSARDYIKDKVSDISLKKKSVEASFDRVDKHLSEIDYDFYQQKLDSLEYQLKTEEQEYSLTKSASESMLEDYKQLLSKRSYLQTKLEQAEQSRDEIEKHKKVLEEAANQLDGVLKSGSTMLTVPGYDYRLKSIDTKIGSLTANIEQYKSSIQEYEKSEGMCPILKAQCPHTEQLNKFYCESVSSCQKAKDDLAKLEIDRELTISERKKASELASTAHNLLGSITDTKNKIRALQEEGVKFADLLNKLADVNESISRIEPGLNTDRIERLLNSISSLKGNISAIKNLLLDFDIATSERIRLDKELQHKDTKLRELTTAAKLVSPKGLPHILLQEVLAKLESLTNSYLKFVNMSVTVSGYAELKSLEDYCLNDGAKFGKNDTVCRVCGAVRENKMDETITIFSNDSGVEWYRESSGGRALIALAIRLALFKMAKEKKANADFMILDEVFTNLDSENKLNALKMLKYAMQDLELKQIFLVSHDEIKDYTDKEIVISHDNGVVTVG